MVEIAEFLLDHVLMKSSPPLGETQTLGVPTD